MVETTSLGAAMAAAITVNLWCPEKAKDSQDSNVKVFKPEIDVEVRNAKFKRWGDAIQRSLNWQTDSKL